jgi:hypothetical protein
MWEIVSAVATALTGIIILVTVVLGSHQLRVTNRQLEQLQRATQLEGTMKIFEVLRGPQFQEAWRFLSTDFERRMKDEEFRSEAERISGVDVTLHKERFVMRTYEEIGTYVRHGLLSGKPFFDYGGAVLVDAWERLSDVVAAHRRRGGENYWMNFEYLYIQAKKRPTKSNHTDRLR